MRSRYETFPSATVHVLEFENGRRPGVAIHGLGGSAYNWAGLAPRLDLSIAALDLPGFGLSPPMRRPSIASFTDVALEFVARAGAPVTLLGNSMGGLIAMDVARRRPDLVDRLVLIAPATRPAGRWVPAEKLVPARLALQAIPGVGEGIIRAVQNRMTPEEQVAMTFRLLTKEPSRISAEQMALHVEVAKRRRALPWAIKTFRQSTTSTLATLARLGSIDRLAAGVTCPTLLVFGDCDPVVEPEWQRRLAGRNPQWRSIEMKDIGHVPMLESPVAVASIISDWISAT